MGLKYRVAFLGFTEFERTALGSYFRLANRDPRYAQVQMLTDADFLIADADHGPSVHLVAATDRMSETVFIGSQAPAGAVAWMTRPIDALHVMRELDAMVTVQRAGASEHAAGGSRVVPRRRPLLPPATPPEAGQAGAEDPAEEAPPLKLREFLRPPAPAGLLERAAAASSARSRRAGAPPAAQSTPLPAAPSTPVPVAPSNPVPVARSTPIPVAPLRPPASTGQSPRALIIDDSAIAQRYLEIHLLRWGLAVDRADSSARGVELMQRHSYDLVFLDVELGPASELDGLGLCQQIKHSVSAMNVTVVMISAHHTELDRVRGALAGCDAYLGKPLDQAELDRLLLRHGLTPPSEVRRKGSRAKAAP